MIRLIRAEFRKLTATTLWWRMLLGSLALTALFVSLPPAMRCRSLAERHRM